MPEKNLIHVWKETLSSRASVRDTFKGMHLGVLHQAVQQKLDEHFLFIQFEIHGFVLCELKGRPRELKSFPIPTSTDEILWLCLQFHGKLTFPTGNVSQPDTFFSFSLSGSENLLTVPAEKQWVLLLGITGASRQQILAEQPSLRKQYEQPEYRITTAAPISYVERQILEQFSKMAFGPFTTVHHIGLLLGKLFSTYTEQMRKQGVGGKEEALVVLYHQAVKYITENYMDEDMSREKIADACNCSVRNLTRAFAGRSNSMKSSILLLRLHKSRELLRKNAELTIEQIAGMLHFPSGQHFATQYKKCFHCTPSEERKEKNKKRSARWLS